MKTTLNKIWEHNPSKKGGETLLKNLGKREPDDAPLSIAFILESNGLEDALWCLRAVDGYQREMRLFAVDCARSVQHLTNDPRSVSAIDVAERHADGNASNEELAAAGDAARDAAWASSKAAWDASWAAWHAAWAATWDAALGAAGDSARAAAPRAGAWGAAKDAAEDVQANLLAIVCAEIEQREE